LAGAHLERADLWEAHLDGANLEGATLAGADLGGACLEKANLRGAHLEAAELNVTYLAGADLSEAHLEGAHLGGAHLKNADLTGAHLESADLWEAHVEGANLQAVKGLTQAQLERAVGDRATKLPDGLSTPAHWSATRDEDGKAQNVLLTGITDDETTGFFEARAAKSQAVPLVRRPRPGSVAP
jgi:hypothetical protein